MYAPGHLGLATILYAPIAVVLFARGHRQLGWAGFLIVAGAGVAPDVDILVTSIAHRGPTHTVWAAGLLALGVYVVAPALPRGFATDCPARPALLCAFGVITHLLGDVITPMGIRPFAPVSDASYTLDLVLSRNPELNMALFTAGVIAILAVASTTRPQPPLPGQTPDPVDAETKLPPR